MLALVPCSGALMLAPQLLCRNSGRMSCCRCFSTPDRKPKRAIDGRDECPVEPRVPRVYVRDPDDSYFEREQGRTPIDEGMISALVAERSSLRASCQYDDADAIKAKCLALGVTIVDMRGAESWYVTPRWSRYTGPDPDVSASAKKKKLRSEANPGFGERGHDYSRTGGGAKGKAGQTSLKTVDDILANRLEAKLQAQFDRADAFLMELGALGVSVCDETKQWRADGVPFESALVAAAEYQRVAGDGDDNLSELDEAAILSLLAGRLAAKRRRDFSTADDIAASLRRDHSVIVDDQRRAWRVVRFYGDYHRVGTKVGRAEPKIGELLTELSVRRREHGDADVQVASVSEQLASMGVLLDEERKTWKRPKRTEEQMAKVREEMAAKQAELQLAKANRKSRGKGKTTC